jgi:hypothetical protein
MTSEHPYHLDYWLGVLSPLNEIRTEEKPRPRTGSLQAGSGVLRANAVPQHVSVYSAAARVLHVFGGGKHGTGPLEKAILCFGE